jgi:hypothetical protein
VTVTGTICFNAGIEIRGIKPLVRVSASCAAKLKPGWRKPMPVLVRIDNKPPEAHRVNLMPAGDGSFYLYLNGILREAAGASVGDRVTVEIEWDAEYRGGPRMPCPHGLRRLWRNVPGCGRTGRL